ncbi:MAG: methyltransferase domain-containing protein [Pseudomonadota bacterium]
MNAVDRIQAGPDARFWDRIAERYARKPVPDPSAYETKLAKTDGYLNPTDRVLEVGCGTGTTALHHAPRAGHILGTDIAPNMIAIAREKALDAGVDNVSFEISSVDALAVPDEPFDLILAHSVLHLLEDVPGSLGKLHGLLKPGGLLISNTQCIGDTAAWLGVIAPLGRRLGLLPRISVFREPQFMAWLADAGFDVVEVWHPGPKASHYLVARAIC